KLVWKAHRRVCGPDKAKLFMWPLLSQLEADEIMAHMSDPSAWITVLAPPCTSVEDGLKYGLEVNVSELPAIIRECTVGTAEPVLVTRTTRSAVLEVLRALEALRLGIGPSTIVPVTSGIDPVMVTAFHDLFIANDVGTLAEPWRPLHRHLTLIIFFLLDLWDRSAGKEPPSEWFDRLFARYNDFVRVKIAPTQPQLASTLNVGTSASEILSARLQVASKRAA
ncbi:uncharacterized protein RHOBADRAFT_47605, partial [Rhodotorula graminis WP1]